MGRAKLEMKLIDNEKSRHSTFKKRKEGLLRKMHEFTTLCDVDACIIMYPPKQQENSSEEEAAAQQAEIWPNNNPDEVSRLINIYRTNSNASQKFTLTDFYHCRKKKIRQELEKKCKKRMELVYPTQVGSTTQYSETQWRVLANNLGNKLDIVKRKIASIKEPLITTLHLQNKFLTLDGELYPQESKPQMIMTMIENNYNVSVTRSFMPRAKLGQRNSTDDDQLGVYTSSFVNSNDYHIPLPQLCYRDLHNHQMLNHTIPGSADCQVQYASFKQEILYAPPGENNYFHFSNNEHKG
ncbi:OLC1v1038910C1 [Oldenlandia corymbosa var. corymbosa]|uniref:OLC1v1038910C1 n=1 Tax=Oldenlandia corymbosa var. corymbosa TaxID=529605 RepID=A0AAV1D1E7_OLDCO|nr:OLC1v1038910C1 [Oldenlandia corymbosa var. corymbosa]